jgi:hypothetical protein
MLSGHTWTARPARHHSARGLLESQPLLDLTGRAQQSAWLEARPQGHLASGAHCLERIHTEMKEEFLALFRVSHSRWSPLKVEIAGDADIALLSTTVWQARLPDNFVQRLS